MRLVYGTTRRWVAAMVLDLDSLGRMSSNDRSVDGTVLNIVRGCVVWDCIDLS